MFLKIRFKINMKLLHVGLGKCGSTFLQNEIFPQFAEKNGIEFIDLYDNKYLNIKKDSKFHLLEKYHSIEKKFPKNFIISNEGLFSKAWEFSRIEKSFEIIKNNFSRDTTILIIIRNPYELLNSIYCQVVSKGKVLPPENFFYVKKSDKIKDQKRFNLYNFNYEKLIKMYKKYYDNVIVEKYENIKKLDFLKKISNLNDREFIKINIDKQKKINRSISAYGIWTTLFLNKFLDVEKTQVNHRLFIKKFKNKLIKSILSKFLLKNFFQYFIDKILPYKKFHIDKNFIPIDIEKTISEYNKINVE